MPKLAVLMLDIKASTPNMPAFDSLAEFCLTGNAVFN